VHYNVAAEITVKGTVETLKAGPQQGTHVVLKTASGALELLLGPSWYLAERKYTLAKGEQIEVVGAKTQVASGEVLVVREIKKDSETMLFRDRKGLPLWAGRGRR
jgi:DNA/RNA endonuclease YhcR with UshA esterase domain